MKNCILIEKQTNNQVTNKFGKTNNKKLIMKNMKTTQSKIKPIKFGKQSGTTYCFGCKDYTKNFRPQEVKMINKLLREKSHCVVC